MNAPPLSTIETVIIHKKLWTNQIRPQLSVDKPR